VTEIPLHTLHLALRLFSRYCARICPPTARYAVRIDFRQYVDRITLHEVRAFCGVPGANQYVDLADFRFCTRDAEWRLYYADAAGRWRRYGPRPASRNIIELLREVDADAHGLFWGQIDGKSLRWCNAGGRCPGCDAQSCGILGVVRDEADYPAGRVR